MNANLREYFEATVLTNEAIEVHLSYLRPAVEAMHAELPLLREKIQALDEKLSGKIEALDQKVDGKIEALKKGLDGKIDTLDKKLDTKIDTLDKRVNDKIDKLIEQFSQIRASQDGLKWFIGSLALLASGLSIAHSLGWI